MFWLLFEECLRAEQLQTGSGGQNNKRVCVHPAQVVMKDNDGDDFMPGRHAYGPFLLLLSADELAAMTLNVCVVAMLHGYRLRSSKTFRRQAGVALLPNLSKDLGRVRSLLPQQRRFRAFPDSSLEDEPIWVKWEGEDQLRRGIICPCL